MNKKQEKSFWQKYGGWIGLICLVIVWMILRTPAVQDYARGIGYKAEGRVAEAEEALELTGTGRRIFRATRPSIIGRDEFNEKCESGSDDVTLLGCYVDGRIYVFEITEEKLKTANEVTTAHELLHAAWDRMSSGEQNKVREELDKLYDERREWFDEELESYDEAERMEEIYTRAGTKLNDLSEELEKHYAKYFQNRAQIVKFFEEYEAPFLELQTEMEKLAQKIEAERTEIDQRREAYTAAVESLDKEISEFNECADTAGCFINNTQFSRRRNVLVAEKEKLETERTALNEKITQNNARIEEYRKQEASLGALSDAMNSKIAPVEEVK